MNLFQIGRVGPLLFGRLGPIPWAWSKGMRWVRFGKHVVYMMDTREVTLNFSERNRWGHIRIIGPFLFGIGN